MVLQEGDHLSCSDGVEARSVEGSHLRSEGLRGDRVALVGARNVMVEEHGNHAVVARNSCYGDGGDEWRRLPWRESGSGARDDEGVDGRREGRYKQKGSE